MIDPFNTVYVIKHQRILAVILYYDLMLTFPAKLVIIIMDVLIFERNPFMFIGKRLSLFLKFLMIVYKIFY